MPSLVQLQYALAVEEHRHFGKASKACHVTQPTLSQSLQKLEDEVGLVLFDRLKKPVLPTPEGRQFLQQAKVVLRAQEKLLYIAEQTRRGSVGGEFRLGVIPTVASDLLPLFLPRFAQDFGQVRLFIEELKTASLVEALAQDRLDGAILATPVEAADCHVRPLYYEQFYVYLAAGHPLLRTEVVDKDALDPGELWLLQDGHCFSDQVANFCAAPGAGDAVLGNVHFRSGSLDTLRRLVKNGRGHTLIPAMMALSLSKPEQQAHVRGFKAPVPAREISIMHRRDHWKLNVIEAIEKTIGEHLPPSIHPSRHKAMQVLTVG